MDVAAGKWHEASVFDNCASTGRGVDNDFRNDSFVLEDHVMLDSEELLERLFAHDATAGRSRSLGVLWQRLLDGLAEVRGSVAEIIKSDS